MATRTALIVGAGIGGLAAATALRRAGWDVRVVERASSPRELGFALLLAPNAMHALRELGLADAVRHGGVVTTSGEMRRPDGTVLRRFDTSSVRALLDEDTVCILRPVLHGALLDAVGLPSIDLGAEAASVTAINDSVQLIAADGRAVTGDILIGADGVASVVRRRLHPDESLLAQAACLPFAVWRATWSSTFADRAALSTSDADWRRERYRQVSATCTGICRSRPRISLLPAIR